MKILFKYIFWIFLILLLAVNLGLFVNGMNLSNQIYRFEKESERLHRENLSLENKAYEIDSLKYASSIAPSLNFTNSAQPVYLENLKYALKR